MIKRMNKNFCIPFVSVCMHDFLWFINVVLRFVSVVLIVVILLCDLCSNVTCDPHVGAFVCI